MLQSFASTKRAPFRLWTGSIQSCRSRPEEPSDMVLSTTVTVRFRSTPRSTPRPARCWAKPHLVTPVAEFVAFLEQIVASLPQGQQIHIIADNLSAHRTSRVWQFIDRHRNLRIHFTPTYSSWLNQVEIWLSKIQRDVIARGIFRSVKDLAKKLMTYIRRYNAKAKPFKWSYRSAERRINPVSALNATPH